MAEKNISQHKRLAMGEVLSKYAKGGMVKPRQTLVLPRIPGQPLNPVTKMKMQNGIPGMRKGGSTTKKGSCKC